MPGIHPIASLAVAALQRGLQPKGSSLLVTLYGDAFAHRGQAISLTSLIALVGMFGLSSRLVRTTVFRLTADDWLLPVRQGRHGFYRLSRTGELRVRHAERHIYDFRERPWDGRWTLVIVDPRLKASVRQHLARELLWDSFGQLRAGLFAHPRPDHAQLRELLDVARATDSVAVLVAEPASGFTPAPLSQVTNDIFRLQALGTAWEQFNRRFEPLRSQAGRLGPCDAFYARILLVHEYRRVLLRDPDLPQDYLAPDWPGTRARALCADLYAALFAPSEAFLAGFVATSDGALRPTPATLLARVPRRDGTGCCEASGSSS